MPRLRTVLLPVAVLSVAVAGWTGIWHWGAGRAEEVIQRWQESQAANGRVIHCARRSSGGYPFRMEITCDGPVVELRDDLRPVQTYRFERLRVVSQIWNPGHVIAEATGPMTVTAEADPSVITATWRLAQASARLAIGGYDSSTVVVDDLAVSRDGAPLLRAARGELHTRPNPADAVSVDIVSKVNAALFGAQAAAPVDAEVQLVARKLLRDARRPQPLPLPQWHAAGGSVDLVLMRVAQGEALGIANGSLRLTDDGRPAGQIELRVANFERVLEATGLGASLGPVASGALMLASRPVEVEGRPGLLLVLRANQGRLELGPLRIPLPSVLR